VALLDKDGQVLLHRRTNTGYMDGRYDLPSGHVEPHEEVLDAAVREPREEAGVTVQKTDLRLWHINQFAANGEDYYNFFFVADAWQGEPTVCEPEKCDDMQFFPLDNLPKMTAGSHVAIPLIKQPGVTFGYIDQKTYDEIAA
jgi:8-oxo-dGTP diphosphatase